MIRKFGTVDAPVELVRRIFSDIETWPEWMPAVHATRILERSENRVIAEIDRFLVGKRTGTFDFRFTPDGHHEHQVSGPAKKWESDWRFQVGPDNSGTLISCRLHLEMGIIGILASSRRIQRWIDRTFEETLKGVRKQARILGAKSSIIESDRAKTAVSSARVFATPTGLEIWIGDRRYVAHAAD